MLPKIYEDINPVMKYIPKIYLERIMSKFSLTYKLIKVFLVTSIYKFHVTLRHLYNEFICFGLLF